MHNNFCVTLFHLEYLASVFRKGAQFPLSFTQHSNSLDRVHTPDYLNTFGLGSLSEKCCHYNLLSTVTLILKCPALSEL